MPGPGETRIFFAQQECMNNKTLFDRIKKLVSTERRIGVEILECLHEIERRRAYAELRYDGLFTYCVKELGFSDFQAFQRIQAMRALREIPELKSMIQTGSLTVSSVSMVQTHLKKERKSGRPRSTPEKLELFQAMENCTSREVETRLAEVRGEVVKQKLVLELDEEMQALWAQVKNLAAHRSHGDEGEVLRLLMKEWLKRHDPSRDPVTQRREVPSDSRNVAVKVAIKGRGAVPRSNAAALALQRTVPLSTKVGLRGRYISASMRKEIWKRDGSQCTHCGSKFALEIDHRQPFALGGGSTKENLRLLCRSCNRFAAVRVFGAEKLEKSAQDRKSSDSSPALV